MSTNNELTTIHNKVIRSIAKVLLLFDLIEKMKQADSASFKSDFAFKKVYQSVIYNYILEVLCFYEGVKIDKETKVVSFKRHKNIKKLASLPNFLNKIKKVSDSEMANTAESKLKKLIKDNQETFNKYKDLRDKIIAHYEYDFEPEFKIGQLKKLNGLFKKTAEILLSKKVDRCFLNDLRDIDFKDSEFYEYLDKKSKKDV